VIIRRVGVFSCAKIEAALCAVLGLFVGAMIALLSMLDIAILPNVSGGILGVMLGAGAIIMVPLAGSIYGAIMGVLWALLYNVAARLAGGIELETE
jgi:hypothetical protein|tara:strand:+ start:200 stop:487 length:288 start_codon:yes stop_codon:yes gene_type:complete